MSGRETTFPDRPISDPRDLGIRVVKSGGLTLIARADCRNLVEQVIGGEYVFKGFEAFTLFADGSVQPHLEWSCDWPTDIEPSVGGVMDAIDRSPEEVSHFEFYYRLQD